MIGFLARLTEENTGHHGMTKNIDTFALAVRPYTCRFNQKIYFLHREPSRVTFRNKYLLGKEFIQLPIIRVNQLDLLSFIKTTYI